jgi:hypothetical protein
MISQKQIENRIFTICGIQLVIDRDLAVMDHVEVERLSEQVTRNLKRFPEAFRFIANDKDNNEPVANCDRFKSLNHSTNNPYAFTEKGIAIPQAVLRNDTAIRVSIQISVLL